MRNSHLSHLLVDYFCVNHSGLVTVCAVLLLTEVVLKEAVKGEAGHES